MFPVIFREIYHLLINRNPPYLKAEISILISKAILIESKIPTEIYNSTKIIFPKSLPPEPTITNFDEVYYRTDSTCQF